MELEGGGKVRDGYHIGLVRGLEGWRSFSGENGKEPSKEDGSFFSGR